MYVPRAHAMLEDELRPFVAAIGSAELVTVDDAGMPLATRLPILWEDQTLRFHLALANPHWRTITDRSPALAIVTGPEGYVSPGWYPSKAKHGRVVPTWNYSAVHFRGHATVHRDAGWLRDAVRDLTDQHERHRPDPWAVSDAPDTFVEQQLKAIVGIELAIDEVEAKAKRSQNRSTEDRLGVIAGLRAEGGAREVDLAATMEQDLRNPRDAG